MSDPTREPRTEDHAEDELDGCEVDMCADAITDEEIAAVVAGDA